MESVIRKLRIQTYRAQLEACGLECVALKKELKRVDLPQGQMLTMGERLVEATKEILALQHTIAYLDRLERTDETAQ